MQEPTNQAPSTEQPEVVTTPEVETGVAEVQDAEQPEGQAPVVEDDSEEIEKEGQKYRIPKALKGELMMHADYTRKTQAVAEERKALEAERNQIRQINDEMLNARASVISIDNQLAQYQQVDWQALIDKDPITAQKLQADYISLQNKRQAAVNQYSQAEQQANLRTQQDLAKRVEETAATLQRDIPNWSPALQQTLSTFAKSLGFQDHQIKAAMAADAPSVKLLHMAHQFAQTLKKAAPQPPAQITPKPVAKVGGASKATKDPSDMTDKEFADWRRRQIAQRN